MRTVVRTIATFILILIPTISWAFPGGKIAFSVAVEDWKEYHLYTVNADGTGLRRLNQNGMWPSWFPDGQNLCFSQRNVNTSDIYVMDVDNRGNKRKLTQIDGDYSYIQVSPDGQKIGCAGYTKAQGPLNLQIWTMNPEGGQLEQMTDIKHPGPHPFSVWGLSWSPDGSRIVFSRTTDREGHRLFILDVRTKAVEGLTFLKEDFYPVWSRDERKVVFRRWNREMSPLLLIDVQTKGIEHLLDADNRTEVWAAWSPDGKHLLYSTNETLHLIDVETKQSQPLAQVEGIVFGLSWWGEKPQAVRPHGKLTTKWGQIKNEI